MKALKDRGIAIIREACGTAGATSKVLQRVASKHGFTLPGILAAGKAAGLLRYDDLHARWYAEEPAHQEKPARVKKRAAAEVQEPAGPVKTEPVPAGDPSPGPALELPAVAPVHAQVVIAGDDPLLEITTKGFEPVGDSTFQIRLASVRMTVSQIERVLAWAHQQHQ